jgi:hypothetical protein
MNKVVTPSVKAPEVQPPKKTVGTKQKLNIRQNEPLALEDIPGNTPLDQYELEAEQPYVVELLDYTIPYYNAEEGTTRESLDLIDDFIKREILHVGYKPDTTAYEKILKVTKKKLGIDESTIRENALERLAGFVEAYNRLATSEEKVVSKGILKKLYLLAKDRDYDKEGLTLYLEEEYIKWQSNQ